MPKTKLTDIFKPEVAAAIQAGTFEVETIDYSSPEQKKKLAELKKQSDRILKNKEIDWTSPALNRPMTI